jgi:hypothetical protein
MWRQTHFDVTHKNNNGSFEDLDIHYHWYDSSSCQTCCDTRYNVCINFQNCHYSIFYIRARVAQWVRWLDYLTTHISLSPIRRGFAPGFVNYKKGCTRLTATSDKVYQLLAHDRWFSPCTSASSTTKTGHDIAEILLKVALNTKNQKSYIIYI